ncbi:MAG: tetratricopeptide repeat protein [Verrucomicrobia bacterium]|nr:tetratricopeptide repeat protein [Verrucomicrobiota bacterium]MDA1086890.1 tetratricopeptide repeat protein [Verrucomicrobiota bacterium]
MLARVEARRIKRASILLGGAVLALLLSCRARTAQPLPGVVRQDGDVYLIENNSSAYIVWQALQVTNATLVHLDTHDDCRYVSPQNLRSLRALVSSRDFETIFHKSDLSSFFNFELKQADFLFDLGNFIYPCLADGTVATFYWVVPQKSISREENAQLSDHWRRALMLDQFDDYVEREDGGFEFTIFESRVILTTLDGLPAVSAGALLDLDTDFFAFPRAMTDTHIPGALQWDPRDVCLALQRKVPRPLAVTVCASVWGGYLPLELRIIPEGCFDFFSRGAYPQEAVDLLVAATAMRERRPIPDVAPPSVPYAAAHQYWQGRLKLGRLDWDGARHAYAAAGRQAPVYKKAFLDAARTLSESGRPAEAVRMLEAYVEIEGRRTLNSETERARAALIAGDLALADRVTSELMEWTRDHTRIMLRAGVEMATSNASVARDLYREALVAQPRNAGLHYNVGVTFTMQGNTNDAIHSYQAAVALDPDLAAAHYNLAELLGGSEDWTRAIEHFAEFVRLDAANPSAHVALGNIYLRAEHYKQAMLSYIAALEINPELAEAHSNLGYVLAAADRLDDAVKHYREALRIAPGMAPAHGNLGAALMRLGRRDEAIRHFRHALSLDPAFEEVRQLLAEAETVPAGLP